MTRDQLITADSTIQTPDLLVTGIGQLCPVHDPGGDGSGPRRGRPGPGAGAGGGRPGRGGRPSAGVRARSRAGPLFLARRQPRPRHRAGGCPWPGRGAGVGGSPHPCRVRAHPAGRIRATHPRRDVSADRRCGRGHPGLGARPGGRDHDDLLALTCRRLERMLDLGTTTVEIKSGYGLSLESELQMLRVAGEAAAIVGVRAVLTCLAAHEVPDEYRDHREIYVDLVCEEVLPRVAEEGLAQQCDVFCEPSVFDLTESERILERGRAGPRPHRACRRTGAHGRGRPGRPPGRRFG